MDSTLTHGQNLHRERELLLALDAEAAQRWPVGFTLKNACIVLAAKAAGGAYDIVLAFCGEHAGDPFCVWKIDQESGDTYWGDYYHTIESAVVGFQERV